MASKTRRHSKTAYPSYSKPEISSESSDSILKPKASKTQRRISENTIVSIQNLQFPDTTPNKPGVFYVKHQNNLLIIPEMKSTPPVNTGRGYDFTSSTNSNFKEMILTVPKNFQAKCSSSSTDAKPRKTESSETLKSSKSQCHGDKNTSQELIDSYHKSSEARFVKAKWKKPCKESFLAGAPRKFLGSCPPNYEQIAKRSKSQNKFFLTQDPRKVHCLVNPAALRTKEFSKKKEFNAFTKMITHAQNTCTATASESSEDFICEVIDLENPLQLDFQGLDYSNTYQKDEQDFQNQCNYRKICRYMERRKIKAETQNNVEEELHHQLIDIPERFKIRDRSDHVKPISAKAQIKLGELYRSADKEKNSKQILMEKEQRRKRYKNLYLKNKTRQEQEKKLKEKRDKTVLENLPLTLADINLQKVINNIDEIIEKSTAKDTSLKATKSERRTYPRTMQETKQFKHIMKYKNLIARDKARIAKKFFIEKKGKIKEFPAADLDISSETFVSSDKASRITEQSTDDADDMEVGKRGSKFKLRGFQSKLNSSLRGKLTLHEKLQGTNKEKGCITRDEWLKELAPKKQKIKLDIDMGIQKPRTADDPHLILFQQSFGFRVPQAKQSTIKNYINKPLGRHYERVRRKNLKFAKPRVRYNVQKFNLIRYRFGETAKKFSQLEDPLADVQILKLKSTNEYITAKALKEKRHQEYKKQKRLRLLGIPCNPMKKFRLQTKCERSISSSDSDWVPQQEPAFEEGLAQTEKEILPLYRRCNMPAPKYREPTLRQHPRYPRDYENQRVPSEIFDKTAMTTNLPFMRKLDKDRVQFANVELKKRPYTDRFEARHHHDHWDSTQVKQVDVHYHPYVVKPEITKLKNKSDRVVMETFRKANPPCNQFVDMNLTLPQCDIEKMIENHYTKSSRTKSKHSTIKNTPNLCTQKDYKLQTRDPKDLEDLHYPGRQEYLQLLKDVRELYKEARSADKPDEKLYVNKDELIKELEEDLKSIESCLTSLSSSVCTNFSNDSGSFLLMDGKEKIPLDFIRKSVVPFEELQRSRFRAVPIDVDIEQKKPFQILPFSGQKKAQLELTTAKDSYFTFNTRLKNGMRLRMEVPVGDVREMLLGKGSNKHKGMVATDIDENYVEELKNRPSVKLYKMKTGQSLIKDALRLKFESMLIQGQIVRTKIFDRLNEQHWTDMLKVGEIFEKLFAKWEKREYDAAIDVAYKVKIFYDETDRLKTELKELEREMAMLNMDIVFTEGHWVRCIMLQNFHYLLGDQEWRLKNDWIHRLENGAHELENFEDSIAKRSTLNIRKREKDDAWAIKSYYENEYLRNKHDNLVVFENAESFLKGLEILKAKTFILLLEMHFTLAMQTELQYKLESFMDWCAQDLREKEQYVSKKCAKLYFMADRAKWLSQRTSRFLEEPLAECFNDQLFLKDRAVITEAWSRIVPSNLRGSSGHELYTVDMVATILEVIMDLLAKFETIPMDLTLDIENKVRTYRSYLCKQSYQAYHIERRIDKEMKKVVKNLEPPYQKPKQISKLPRYNIKKHEKRIAVKEKVISEKAKFFFRAFHEGELTMDATDIRDSVVQVFGKQEQIVPFYFDHFLKLNGYTPNYNFKTQIEKRDGLEIDRFQIKSVIPEVQERMEQWETIKRKIMEEHIAQNPKMYINVMT